MSLGMFRHDISRIIIIIIIIINLWYKTHSAVNRLQLAGCDVSANLLLAVQMTDHETRVPSKNGCPGQLYVRLLLGKQHSTIKQQAAHG